jgi:hypothetical protein
MSRCPPELLDDLAGVFDEVLRWPGVVEKSPGVFYVGRQPFLHFHLLEGRRRRADVKGRAGWSSLDIPRPLSLTKRQALRRLLRARYGER